MDLVLLTHLIPFWSQVASGWSPSMGRFLTLGKNSFSLAPFSLFPSHVMVIVIIHPGPCSLSMDRLKPRAPHSDQQTPFGGCCQGRSVLTPSCAQLQTGCFTGRAQNLSMSRPCSTATGVIMLHKALFSPHSRLFLNSAASAEGREHSHCVAQSPLCQPLCDLLTGTTAFYLVLKDRVAAEKENKTPAVAHLPFIRRTQGFLQRDKWVPGSWQPAEQMSHLGSWG